MGGKWAYGYVLMRKAPITITNLGDNSHKLDNRTFAKNAKFIVVSCHFNKLSPKALRNFLENKISGNVIGGSNL